MDNLNRGIPAQAAFGKGDIHGVQETPWENLLLKGYALMLRDLKTVVGDPDNHFDETPQRMVNTLKSIFWGVNIDPKTVLKVFKESRYDQMIWVNDIDYVSYCRHHLWPFIGKVYFGYLPDKQTVGLSKIPRLVEVLTARPQLQESLAQEIVDHFYEAVQPLGCGVVVTGAHTCMCARGVRKNAIMQSQALKGNFLSEPSTKQEFIEGTRVK